MSKKAYVCRKCHKAKKGARMNRDRTFCTKCMKAQMSAVKFRRAQLVKAGVVSVTKGGRKSGATAITPPPRPATLAEQVPWNSALREQDRAVHAPGGPEQQDMAAATWMVKDAGCRTVKELYETTAQANTKELCRRVMLLTGERF